MFASSNLQIPADHVANHLIQELFFFGVRHIAEGLREFIKRRAGEVSGNSAAVVHAAMGTHEAENPVHVFVGTTHSRLPEEGPQSQRVCPISVPEQMYQHQRPFAFEQIAGDLLSIPILVTREIEEVVLNLKGGAEVIAETIEAIEVGGISRRDQRADAAGMDEAIPARFLQNHS